MPIMKVLLLLLGFGGLAHCARILAVLPISSKSHSIMQYAILRLLAQRGHEVTVYSVYPPPYSVANLTHTLLPTFFSEIESSWTFEQFKEMVDVNNCYGFGVKAIWDIASLACEDVFNDDNIKALFESKQRFDLIFLEVTLGQESLAVFGHKFKAPIVNFQGFTTWSLIDWVTGNSLSISHVPEVISFPFTNKMSFKERLQNFVSTVLTFLFYHFDHLPRHQNIIKKYLKDPNIPHVSDMLNNIAITLANSQRTLEYPRPYTPNVIPIAGAHMSSHMTPLPQNIKHFMDNAKRRSDIL
ncbi:UDP-glucuronosyltransferase 1-1 [Homalodisca vitripennis]|nr:UDP-glucuronosyltransferase 1-1 [Homalodisca vitripennis]